LIFILFLVLSKFNQDWASEIIIVNLLVENCYKIPLTNCVKRL